MQKKSRYWMMVAIAIIAFVVLTALRVPALASLALIVAGFAIASIVTFKRSSRDRQ